MKDEKTRGSMDYGVGGKYDGSSKSTGKTPGKYTGMKKVLKGGKAKKTSKHY